LCFRSDKGIGILEESSVDAICVGEGDGAFVNILEIIERNGKLRECRGIVFRDKEGRVVDSGDGPLLEDLDLLPFADFSDFQLAYYKKKMIPTSIGRGCINRCIFCSEWERFPKYRCRSALNVYNEIKYQKEKYPYIEEVILNDSLVNGNIKVLDELCNLLIENETNIKWGGQAIIRREMSLEFLKKMKKAGCYYLSYGVESGSDDILRLMRKTFTSALASKVIRETREAGLDESFNIIVGFPGEDEEKFNETANFVKNNLEYVNLVLISPLYLSQELARDKEKWEIVLPDNGGWDGWATEDKINNEEIRFDRLKVLRDIVRDKLLIDFDIELGYYLKEGDRLFKEEYKKEAASFYLKARVINKDKNFEHIIEEKIKSCYPNRITFSWDIHYKCNFRCPYCWFYKEWVNLGRRSLNLNPDEWMSHWRRIHDKYGECKIDIGGGEPFIYPNFIELVTKLSSLHYLKVMTNLSGDIERFAKEINPGRVELDLNFHILFIEAEAVIKKATILKNSGFKGRVCYLAYPPQMKHIPFLNKQFKDAGLNFTLAAFFGEYDGRKYPKAYTQEEKELIRPYLGDIDRLTYHLNGQSRRGKLCNAGYLYANIKGDGSITRCSTVFNEPFANITEDNFRLLDFPQPCSSESGYCPCNEWAFLLVKDNDRDVINIIIELHILVRFILSKK